MKLRELKSFIREAVRKSLAENQPATAPSKPATQPTIHPGKPGTDKPKPRRPLGNPDVKPKPKAITENEQDIVNKIVQRMKSKK
jgi:hypothetical protein